MTSLLEELVNWFPSIQAAFDALQHWVKQRSFAVILGRYKKNSQGEIYRRWVYCSKFGVFESESTDKQQTTSSKEDCKWQAILALV